MHEMGIASSALTQVLSHAAQAGATQVHGIALRVGALSGVDPEALRFAFSVLLPESLASGAELFIEEVPAEACCNACATLFEPQASVLFECPHCHALDARVTRGRELDLIRIDLSKAS